MTYDNKSEVERSWCGTLYISYPKEKFVPDNTRLWRLIVLGTWSWPVDCQGYFTFRPSRYVTFTVYETDMRFL